VVRAIVFDFDGVLANSEPLHFRAYREVLAAEGVTLTENEYYARYLGYDDRGAFEAIGVDRGRSWSADAISALVERKAHTLETLETAGDLLFPGARAAVEASAAALPIAIASGARTAEILRALGHAGLAELFTAIVGAEATARSKPAPDPYLKAVALLRERRGPLSPRECVAVEDSQWGLESARAAGLKTVGVTQTYDAASIGPADLVIPSLLQFDLEAIRQRFS
jgi:beta-phosphoglucomutase-like phosphatase (HAD superfamily)